MIRAREWSYGPAQSSAIHDNGIALMRTTGTVAPVTAPKILMGVSGTLRDWYAGAMVSEYTNARMEIAAGDLFQSASRLAWKVGGILIPVAIVVKRDDYEMWREYAQLMAQAGIVRGVFLDQEPAIRWARLQAALFSDEQAAALRIPASGR